MLLERVESYLKYHRMPPARFGREAVGDPCFVFDLRDGRVPRARTVARVDAYIARQPAEQVTGPRSSGASARHAASMTRPVDATAIATIARAVAR